MRCPKCSYDENADDATFCGGCGNSLSVAAACPSCGRDHAATDTFCQGCGQGLGDATVGQQATPTPAPALPASFAAGRYQVKSFLGEGATKRVYLAHDNRLSRDVAIALIKSASLTEEGTARIQREGQAMGQLGAHPHIVTAYDADEEAGQHYFVMEYMAGGDLEALI